MKIAATIVSALLLAACASTPQNKMEHDAEDFPTLIKQAEAAVQKSAEIGFEWRDVSKLIGQAKMAAANGDLERAIKLAIQAKRQGELAYQQGLDQQDAGPWLF